MRLILVRHGQSEGNAFGIIQGHLDFALTELGRRQALATAEALRDEEIDRIMASPLKRAFETATLIAALHGLEVEPQPDLMEYNMGEVAGLTGREIRARFPEVAVAFARGVRPSFPGEEGREIFAQRVLGVLETLKSARQTVVAVAHGGVITSMCYEAAGIDRHRPGLFEIANCAITEMGVDTAGRVVIRRHNDTCHLDGLVTQEDRG